jgi:S-adenosylmethionine hydrolase
MAKDANPIITLITDFGTADHFVGAMKGVILSINPRASVIDITHDIKTGDIRQAAFCLSHCYDYFPGGTIHVCIVDPGVGTDRRAILIETDTYAFIAPDNGCCTFILNRHTSARVYTLENKQYFLPRVSHTFHGRDIFAPAAAWLSNKLPPGRFGNRISDPMTFDVPHPVRTDKDSIQGEVAYIDKFGNLITTISEEYLDRERKKSPDRDLEIRIKGKKIAAFGKSYAAADPGKLLGLIGSTGYLEIAANLESAKRKLGAEPGDPVILRFLKR